MLSDVITRLCRCQTARADRCTVRCTFDQSPETQDICISLLKSMNIIVACQTVHHHVSVYYVFIDISGEIDFVISTASTRIAPRPLAVPLSRRPRSHFRKAWRMRPEHGGWLAWRIGRSPGRIFPLDIHTACLRVPVEEWGTCNYKLYRKHTNLLFAHNERL